MPAGRPTDYTEDMPDKVYQYITNCIGERICPTIAGSACILGVSVDAIEDWREKHSEFGGAIKELLAVQQDMLQTYGLMNKFNPTMCIFLLKNNHGFKDITGIDHTTKGKELKTINVNIHERSKPSSDDSIQEELPSD